MAIGCIGRGMVEMIRQVRKIIMMEPVVEGIGREIQKTELYENEPKYHQD